MKKLLLTSIGKRIFLFTLVLTLGLTNSCQKDDDGPCGEVNHWVAYIDPAVDVNYTATNGNKITYYLEDASTPEDICSQEHAFCIFEVLSNTLPSDTSFTLKGRIYWKDNYKEDVTFTAGPNANGSIHKASKEIGLKQAFGTEKAWLGMVLMVTFTNKGSTQANKDYLNATFSKLQVIVEYAQHKG